MTSTPIVMATSVKETRTQTLMFDALEPDGSNFLEWNNDVSTYLCAEELDGTLDAETARTLPSPRKWQALLIIRRHMDASLRQQYIQVHEPAELWTQLQAWFKHEETLFLPQAHNDWVNLRESSIFRTFKPSTPNSIEFQHNYDSAVTRSRMRN